ncbi:MAG: hypothetical protein ACSLE9_00900 [Burkholderiaceae bacterium]
MSRHQPIQSVEQQHPRVWWLYAAAIAAGALLSAIWPAGCATF